MFNNKLKNFFIRFDIILAGILLVAFLIRIYGIYFDYPRVNFIWDETYDMAYLMNLLEQKRLFFSPPVSPYSLFLPALYLPVTILRMAYLVIKFHLFNVGAFKDFIIANGIGQIYIVARWYAVFFGTAASYLVYRIYNLIFQHKFSPYFASLVYTVSLLPVFLSHWGKAHSGMLFFVLLSLFFILKFELEKNTKYFYYSAIAAAGSFSIHYIGISAAIFPLLGYIFNFKEVKFKVVLKAAALYVLISLFFYLLNYNGIQMMFQNTKDYYTANNYSGLIKTTVAERFYYVFRDYFWLDPVFLALFFVIMITKGKELLKNKLVRYIIFGLLFNYLLMITIIVGPHMTRWLLIFMTLAVPFAAGFFVEFLREKGIGRWLVYTLAMILIAPSFFITTHWLGILKNNTSLETETWLEQNLKTNDVVYSFDSLIYVLPSYQAAVWNRQVNQRESKKNNYIIENKDKFLGKGVTLMYDYGNNRYKDLAGKETEYVIISYINPVEKNRQLTELKKYYSLRLIQDFYPTINQELLVRGIDDDYLNNPRNWVTLLKLDKSGPFFEIYKVN